MGVPIRMQWITPAATIRAMRMAAAKFSSVIPTSKAAEIAPGIPHMEAAVAASRTWYPQGELVYCIASRLTKVSSHGLNGFSGFESVQSAANYFFFAAPFFLGTLAPAFRAWA